MASHVHPTDTTLRDPAGLFSESIRRLIIASYWLVIIAAIPLWWQTTSIERLSLPTSRVHAQAANTLRFPVHIRLENVQDDSLAPALQQFVQERTQTSGLDVTVDDKDADSYTITLAGGPPLVMERQLTYPVRSGTLPALADTLAALLVPPVDVHRVAQYSPRYRLAFTLLNEDAAAGTSISSWDVSRAISRHLSPILNSLSVLHNFTVESQVQFHAPLAFSPVALPHGYGLTPEDLTVFVNSAEWSLSSSVSNDPVLHFILFIPSESHKPLQILDSNGNPSSSDAFLLPQWGGIVIYNPPSDLDSSQLPPSALTSVFSTFAHQLLILLGVPSLLPEMRTDPSSALTGWQLDALLRRRASENADGARDTLESIVKLVDQIENMPVGQDVRGDVQNSLTALDKMYASTSLNETLHQSADALTLASRAFFNPGMLALLYFPAEHKYAVYTPLFASAVIPLIAAAMREFRAWRKERR
ncbi:phosphatidylinositol-glycan biosynthesis class S protein-domain-containing protein [Roridomyces roridus]|uniref:Phosphatidylinositol-glycan biosynthesis class S protein-domain-containing protein n=1 Tax=Roridomyces roridus TaxID=1738132 RepID=A0AAD7BZ58_9AGAR|nr:phosphatidylinositol-glycan biosynthesis class S protein-domain-containing protein [Roridomyces roridus]